MELRPRSVGFWRRTKFYRWCFYAIAQPLQDFTKFSMSLSIFDLRTELLIRLFILAIPGCPTWNSLKILFWSDIGITTRSPYISILSQIEYMSIFVDSYVLFYHILYFSTDAFLLISSRVTGSFHTTFHRIFLISTSSRREVITVSS